MKPEQKHPTQQELSQTLEIFCEKSYPSELNDLLRHMTTHYIAPTQREALMHDLLVREQYKSENRLRSEIESLRKDFEAHEAGVGQFLKQNPGYEWVESDTEPYEHLVPALEGLFRMAEAECRQKRFSSAREALQGLFDICAHTDTHGTGLRFAALPNLNHTRIKMLYVRSVYETETIEHQAENVFGAMLRMECLPPLHEMSLRMLRDSQPSRPSGLDDFLSRSIKYLQSQEGKSFKWWLQEAVHLRGIEGFALLARTGVEKHPEAYIDWLRMLVEQEKFIEVELIAKEALRNINKDHGIRAEAATFLLEEAKRKADTVLMQMAAEEAFYSEPTLERLLDVWEVTSQQSRNAAMERAATVLRHAPKRKFTRRFFWNEHMHIPATLNMHALLFSLQLDEVMELIEKKKSERYSSDEGMSTFLLAFGLVLLCQRRSQMPAQVGAFWSYTLGQERDGERETEGRLKRSYEQLFSTATLDKRRKLLVWCVAESKAQIEQIFKGNHRENYRWAALVAVACWEMLQCNNKPEQAKTMREELIQENTRRRSFQQELRLAFEASNIETTQEEKPLVSNREA